MVTMITLHIVNEKNMERALWLLHRNTELAREAPGFVSRQVMFAVDDPLKGYSITTWETREDLERFRKSPERPPLRMEGDEVRVYQRTPEGDLLLFTRTDSGIYELSVPD